MIIRDIQAADLSVCADLYTQIFNGPPWNEHWSLEAALDKVSDVFHAPKFIGFLVEDDQQVVGFTLGNKNRNQDRFEFGLREMGVAPDRQGAGIGNTMMAELKKRIKAENVSSICLETSKTAPAFLFYKKHKFGVAQNIQLMTCKL